MKEIVVVVVVVIIIIINVGVNHKPISLTIIITNVDLSLIWKQSNIHIQNTEI